MAVKFVDNTDIVLRMVAQNAEAAMEQVGEALVEAVQYKMLYGYSDPHGKDGHTEIVDTGALFDSIGAEVTRASQNAFTATVSAGTTYAGYVHDGTSKLRGRPFLTDGAMDAQDQVVGILSGQLLNGIT